jgi:glycogen debranching enzyme
MNQDCMSNFASAESNVYLKRELIAWGDSVKLRYGNKPEDSPGLWEYMGNYTLNIARMFHGVRLDNCHNTPLHVAQYFLDLARGVRPDLYVIAELFTNSDKNDNIFVSKLGITSLIRESMNAWNAQELSRLMHRFGGDPVGSFVQPNVRPLKESVTHAVFFDMTHDNKSLIASHTVNDALSRSALLLMCGCAFGSTRGYDELVPHEIHVVKETRPYARWVPEKNDDYKIVPNEKFINSDSSFIKAKFALNKLHFEMGTNGYTEIFVDLLDDEVIAVTRSNPSTHKSFVLLSRTAFSPPNGYNAINEFRVPLKLRNVLFEAILVEDKPSSVNGYQKSESYINGIENYSLKFQENIKDFNESFFISNVESNKDETKFYFKNLPPGAVIAFSFGIDDELIDPIIKLRSNIQVLTKNETCNEFYSILDRLTADELNILLFRVAEEEINEEISSNIYNIPNYGDLVFCGLQGFMNVLEKVRLYNDLGHPIFQNLREGNWIMEYIIRRLKLSCEKQKYRTALLDLSNWLENQFSILYKAPRYMIPAYFDVIMTSLYTKLLDRCFKLMSSNSLSIPNFVLNGSSFIHSLTLASIQLVGVSKSAKLPNTLVNGPTNDYLLSIAAGLPFFSHGIMRNWGRDTFISLKGLLLLTNRHEEAKYLILTYGSCLRHGLIPNLLGEGICARYNARDAIWWWLKGIKDYTECVPEGYKILDEEVYRLYPTDDTPYPVHDIHIDSPKQKLSFIIQEALTVHVNGLNFVERNAGPQIDDHMREEGFHNSIGVDLETGFVFGGNKYNCGTWMDKNGSSPKAGINGIPATPRYGSDVELVALNRNALDWIIKMNNDGHYQYNGVKLNQAHRESQKLDVYTWVEWAARIDSNFEKFFWIDSNSKESPHINKREIYKDTLNSSIPWADYQLRPNFLIALSLAPQMINPEHARKALAQIKENLLSGPNSIGIKTLDPSDYNYNGYYDNSNDSDDPRISHGYNYHNGPEWLWPMGYYLRSVMHYSKNEDRDVVKRYIQTYLSKYYISIHNSDWKGLPELTDENGQDCMFSCPSQAWSIASILEACYEFINF